MDEYDITNLPPELLQKLVAMGALPEQKDILSSQIDQAQAVRAGEGPSGRYSRGTFVAASPLEFAGDVANKEMARRDIDTARRQQQEILKQQGEGRQKFLDEYLKILRGGSGGMVPQTRPYPTSGGMV